MDAAHGLSAILRDARKGALLRMRSEIFTNSRMRKSSNRRLMRDLFHREPPAGAGHLLRRGVEGFFEAHQLPVARAVGEGEAGLAGEPDHGFVGAQRIAEQA